MGLKTVIDSVSDERNGGFEVRGLDRAFHEVSPVDYSLDTLYGQGYRYFGGKPIADLSRVVDQITTGRTIDNANDVITYTFNDVGHLVGVFNNPNNGFTAGIGFGEYSAAQMAAARLAISSWDDLIPQTFRETQGMGADIVFANSSDPDQAYAYYPVPGRGYQYQSDVFTRNPDENWTNEWFTPGGYGNTTLIHELGHTLGLSHPGAYNGSAATTYAGMAEYAQDSMQYTIMSYWAGSSTNALTINWTLNLNNYAQTPMLHDIVAIQNQYGVDTTTRTTDTIYGFGSTAGNEIYNFATNPNPYMSIWDAGGIDTINLSGFTTSQFVDLHAGSFSSIGGAAPSLAAVNAFRAAEGFAPLTSTEASYNAFVASYQNAAASRISADMAFLGEAPTNGITATQYQNFSIAYGVTIENATGGSARDLLHGNEVANTLKGMGGDDVLRGFEGNDRLEGGTGADSLFGDAGNDLIIGGLGRDTLTGGTGNDSFDFNDLEIGDLITDFGAGDMIDLSSLGPNLSFIGSGPLTGAAGEVNYVNGVLSADVNGGGADFSVTLAGMPTMHVDQLILHA